ncbi:glycosyltransferase family 2 protein, partial [Flavihumibacter sp. R14]|nr:glycosyltransferase family 2 protein [Flavihumibacter soli]
MIIRHIPLVSIIIPVYNSEKLLTQAIQSAKDQTWVHTEIIIIDDGSEDSSLAIARSFETENIRVLKQKNQGASAARNMGLHHAKGDYIQFLDADDIISPNKISDQLLLLENDPMYLGLCGTVYFNDGEDPIGQLPLHPGYST